MIAKFILITFVVLLDFSVALESKNCSVKCFFTNKEKEFIKCQTGNFSDSLEYVSVECINDDDMVIGNLESVRSLSEDFLSEMPLVKYLTINLHLVTLEPTVLASRKLLELKLLYVDKIHRNSFSNLPNLENINFGKISKKELPEFFIIKYLERNQMTTLNIGIDCYKCKEDSKELLVFPSVAKAPDSNLYVLQSITVDSCVLKSELKYCNNSSTKKSNETGKHSYRSLKLDQKPILRDTKSLNTVPYSLFYFGVIICMAIVGLLLCLLMLQLWTICQLRKTTKILKGLQFYPNLADSELSDNNETNSYYGHNGILYQHNFPLSKT